MEIEKLLTDLEHGIIPVQISEKEFHEKLKYIISHLLNTDMNRLLNFFYRVDLEETKLKKVLTMTPPDDLSRLLTEMVIERLKLKAEIRKKYSGS